jgi:hypothetical protein
MRLEYELSIDDENAVRRSSMRNLNKIAVQLVLIGIPVVTKGLVFRR